MKPRTFLDQVKLYSDASAWAIKLEVETGQNHDYIKILSICRKPKEENNFPKLSEELQAYIENILYDEDFQQNNQAVTTLCEDLQEIAEMKGLELPGYDTINRYVNYITAQDGEGAQALVAKGIRYWKNRYMMKKYRNTKGLKVLEIVQGDVHKLDFWVRVLRPNGKWQAIRPCLVAWIDMKSRAFVGWMVCESPNAQIMKESLLNVIYPKKNPLLPYGVPKYLLIDNGKEYTAETLTGRPRSVRFTFDEDTKGFYRSIGIEDDMRSLPYQPWSKAQIERFFGTICTKFSKKMKSYTGTLSGAKTSAKVEKNIKEMLEKGTLMTLDECAEHVEKFICEKYHPKTHKGLMIQGEEVPAPIITFNNSERYYKPAPPIDYALSLLMKGEVRKVTTMGIQRTVEGRPIYYVHEELSRFIGHKVQFKYYPDDITKVLVYDMDGKRICEAMSYELLNIAPKLSEDAFIEHNKGQKRQEKSDKETVKQRRKTYEERQVDKETLINNAGKKKAAPELLGEAEKITAMVNDNRYREDAKHKKEKEASQVKSEGKKLQNDYFEKQKEKVIEELFKKLG